MLNSRLVGVGGPYSDFFFVQEPTFVCQAAKF